jgi:HEAT repeat protein
MEVKKNARGLIKALRYKKDGPVGVTAAQALGEIGDSRAVKPSRRALNDANFSVRLTAAYALKKICPPAPPHDNSIRYV